MDMMADLVRAGWQIFLPVTVLSFCLVWWALHRGIVEQGDSLKSLHEELDGLAKAKGEDKRKTNPVHDKWFKFGGGFYGITALYTWLLIEWGEVTDLISGLGELVFDLNIGILISFFIESFMNFIVAIAWPMFWIGQGEPRNFWMWFVAAWAGYTLGSRLARHYAGLPAEALFNRDSKEDQDR